MNQEPSVLDFVKARIHYWQARLLHPSAAAEESKQPEFWLEETSEPLPAQAHAIQTASVQPEIVQVESVYALAPTPRFPWLVLLSLGLGLLGQISLEPDPGSERTWQTGVFLYLLAGLLLVWVNSRQEWALQPWKVDVHDIPQERTFLVSSMAFLVSLALFLTAFIAFGGNRFTTFNVVVWILAILTMVRALWRPDARSPGWVSRVKASLSRSRWSISFDRPALLMLAAIGLVLFFRIYRLSEVPSQMISDHAEKLLDVGDVLNGKTAIFFERNTGREFFQFYLTAGIALLFKTGLTYLSLKIGTVLAGLVTLLYIYLLGKEIGNQRVGLLALVFAGIAYWPNVISRYGLRFPFYPVFYAPALYYLVWGLRTRNRLGFILSGLFLGLGLHGYSPFRVVPFFILFAVGLYLLHRQSEGYRQQAVWGLFAIILMSLFVFLPLLRYMLENPDMVLYRAMTRLGDLERPLPGPAWQIFLQNLWNSLTMFGWDDGQTWPISVTQRPALDVVTAVLFHLGVVLLAIRYIRQRHWLDLFTLLSIPALMMPSVLSLSFPGENPSLNRSAAAIVPVFLLVGLALDGFLRALESASVSVWNKRFAGAAGIFLLAWASLQNYDLVFNQYRTQYDLGVWNTSELGGVVRGFTTLTGSPDTAWLVGYPHWVDSRLVMINAGFPFRDNAIWPENFQDTLDDTRPKLFLININDVAAIQALQSLYPDGWLMEYDSKYENRNFMLFFVPAR
ncbi:MAG TPA: glycosyltransferase family 39 protein [Anaerolineales bacterium]|nr:glycosyltransferase family 39 protein [Anaerolineales bacterium]